MKTYMFIFIIFFIIYIIKNSIFYKRKCMVKQNLSKIYLKIYTHVVLEMNYLKDKKYLKKYSNKKE